MNQPGQGQPPEEIPSENALRERHDLLAHREIHLPRRGELLGDLEAGVPPTHHEYPSLGRTGNEPLVPGDVIAVEPGTYRQGYGGVRLEDLLRITADGCEVLADFPYDLAP